MKQYVLSLDAGTTSSRAILFDHDRHVRASAQKEFTQIYPHEGWVEHDPMEIWATQWSVIEELLEGSGVRPEDLAAIGITNQRETTIVWERATGRPICNAIVWQCRRTAELVDALVEQGYGDEIRKATGLIPDAYFCGTKIQWILDHVDGAREQACRGELLFGTVDSWLIWNLTGGAIHATDRTNASRTMLYNIHTMDWDDRLLDLMKVPRSMLPQVLPSSGIFGYARIGGVRVPISGVAGDQQAALFGQGCFYPGQVKNTYGTGCFTLMHTGSTPVESRNGLLTTVAAGADDKPVYALEGSVFVGGAVIQWLRDEMRFFSDSRDSEYLASKVSDTGGVYLVPAFTGIGAPYWDMYARGIIVGITRGTRREHVIRAAQESIAYQVYDLLEAMEADTNQTVRELRVDGGASRDRFLMQFQSDVLAKPLRRPAVVETTAMGAAMLAGLGAGFWSDLRDLESGGEDTIFRPQMAPEDREEKLRGWHRAVERSLGWAK